MTSFLFIYLFNPNSHRGFCTDLEIDRYYNRPLFSTFNQKKINNNKIAALLKGGH